MVNNTLKVQLKTAWGQNRYYPVNNTAQVFLALLGSKTFTHAQLGTIKALGHSIEVIDTRPVI